MTAPPGGPYGQDPYGTNPYGQGPYWGGQPQGGHPHTRKADRPHTPKAGRPRTPRAVPTPTRRPATHRIPPAGAATRRLTNRMNTPNPASRSPRAGRPGLILPDRRRRAAHARSCRG